VTESQKGRIIEITRDGRLLWEYVNPRQVESVTGDSLVARVPRAFRVGPDYFEGAFAESLRARSERS
jgi:hypothetical protein